MQKKNRIIAIALTSALILTGCGGTAAKSEAASQSASQESVSSESKGTILEQAESATVQGIADDIRESLDTTEYVTTVEFANGDSFESDDFTVAPAESGNIVYYDGENSKFYLLKDTHERYNVSWYTMQVVSFDGTADTETVAKELETLISEAENLDYLYNAEHVCDEGVYIFTDMRERGPNEMVYTDAFVADNGSDTTYAIILTTNKPACMSEIGKYIFEDFINSGLIGDKTMSWEWSTGKERLN